MSHSSKLFRPVSPVAEVKTNTQISESQAKIDFIRNIAAGNHSGNIEVVIQNYFDQKNETIPSFLSQSLAKVINTGSTKSYHRLHAKADFLFYLVSISPVTSLINSEISSLQKNLDRRKHLTDPDIHERIKSYFDPQPMPQVLHKLFHKIMNSSKTSKQKHEGRLKMVIAFIESRMDKLLPPQLSLFNPLIVKKPRPLKRKRSIDEDPDYEPSPKHADSPSFFADSALDEVKPLSDSQKRIESLLKENEILRARISDQDSELADLKDRSFPFKNALTRDCDPILSIEYDKELTDVNFYLASSPRLFTSKVDEPMKDIDAEFKFVL